MRDDLKSYRAAREVVEVVVALEGKATELILGAAWIASQAAAIRRRAEGEQVEETASTSYPFGLRNFQEVGAEIDALFRDLSATATRLDEAIADPPEEK